MPNGDKCPEGMPYGQWLREKGISIKVTEAVHVDSGIPLWLNKSLTNKPHELYDRNLARQGKKIDPEDM